MPLSSTGSVRCRRTLATTRKNTKPTSTPATGGEQEVEADVRRARTRCRSATASAVRSATSAVASLSSDSPSRIVTIRRGSPIRRPIAVAATASGGATTAPIASAIAQETPGSSSVRHQPDAERREHDQPDREQQDRAPVGVEVDERGALRGGVQQRRQQPEQHDLGSEVDLRDPREVRRHDPDRDQQERRRDVDPARPRRCTRAPRPPGRTSSRVISTADILPMADADT